MADDTMRCGGRVFDLWRFGGTLDDDLTIEIAIELKKLVGTGATPRKVVESDLLRETLNIALTTDATRDGENLLAAIEKSIDLVSGQPHRLAAYKKQRFTDAQVRSALHWLLDHSKQEDYAAPARRRQALVALGLYDNPDKVPDGVVEHFRRLRNSPEFDLMLILARMFEPSARLRELEQGLAEVEAKFEALKAMAQKLQDQPTRRTELEAIELSVELRRSLDAVPDDESGRRLKAALDFGIAEMRRILEGE